MKSKKVLTTFLSTMLILSSTVTGSVFADETKSTSKEFKNISSKNYIKDRGSDENDDNNNDDNAFKDCNIGSAIRNAQEKAKEIVKEPVKETPPKVEISQELKDQIKAEYTTMRATQ